MQIKWVSFFWFGNTILRSTPTGRVTLYIKEIAMLGIFMFGTVPHGNLQDFCVIWVFKVPSKILWMLYIIIIWLNWYEKKCSIKLLNAWPEANWCEIVWLFRIKFIYNNEIYSKHTHTHTQYYLYYLYISCQIFSYLKF